MENIDRIRQAIENTKAAMPGYWEKTLKQRISGPESAGSVVEGIGSIAELEKEILSSTWTEDPHPDVAEGSVRFTAHIPGSIGVVELSQLPEDTVVTLDDRKNTGKVSAIVEGVLGEKVMHSSIILTLEDGMELAATFHPGDPVKPSKVDCAGMHGKTVTVKEALKMGLEIGKIG